MAVVAGVVGLAGLSWLAGLTSGPTEPPDATATPRAAVGSPTPRATPRPTPRPTPEPTPAPTLAPTRATAVTRELEPTGILVADIGAADVGPILPDEDGSVWVARSGIVVKADPQTGHARRWTLADDTAFATASLARARLGGVWLLGSNTIRLFDGERFRAVIETPANVWQLVDAPDGTLWAQTDEFGLIRWADGVWTSDPPGRPSRGAASIAVDPSGRIWTSDFDSPEDGGWVWRGVSVWDGTAWATYDRDELPLIEWTDEVPTVLAAADGTVWVTRTRQLARFDGSSWEAVEPGALSGIWRLDAVGDDGRLWLTEDGSDSGPVRIHVLDGDALTTYDDTTGLPGPWAVGWSGASVLPGPGYVLASTQAGLYRLGDGSWRRLATTSPDLPSSWGMLPGWWSREIAAVSSSEIWAAVQPPEGAPSATAGGGLFVFDGSVWREEPLPGRARPSQIVASPDGSLWVAADTGPLLRRGGVWTDLGDLVEDAVGGSAQPGCQAAIALGADAAVYYTGSRSRSRIVALRPQGSTWRASVVAERAAGPDCVSTLEVTTDGTIWNLQRGWGNSLSRLAEDGWVGVLPAEPPGSWSRVNPTATTLGPGGSLWVAVSTYDESGDAGRSEILEIDDLRWIVRDQVEGVEWANDLAFLPDSSLIVVGEGVAVQRGSRWRSLFEDLWFQSVSVAPDGSVWVLGENLYRLPTPLP